MTAPELSAQERATVDRIEQAPDALGLHEEVAEVLEVHEDGEWVDVDRFQCDCGDGVTLPPIEGSVALNAARRWFFTHQADALLPLIERREAEAWPCANYRRPVTCLTAPSSESGRCDFCAEQAKEPAMKSLWMASKEAAERGDIGTADGPAVWEWLMDRADRIGDA